MSRRARDHDDLLFASTYGHVSAIDKRSGDELWRTSLPGTGYLVASMVYEDETLFVGTGGHVFALDPSTGRILWENRMPGLHHGLVQVVTKRSSSVVDVGGLTDGENRGTSGSAAHTS